MYDCPLTKYVRKCFVSDLVQWRLKVLSFSAKCQKTRLKTSFSSNAAWLDCVKLIKFSTKELGVWGSPACGPRCVGTPLPGLGTPCKPCESLVQDFCKPCENLLQDLWSLVQALWMVTSPSVLRPLVWDCRSGDPRSGDPWSEEPTVWWLVKSWRVWVEGW